MVDSGANQIFKQVKKHLEKAKMHGDKERMHTKEAHKLLMKKKLKQKRKPKKM